MEGKAGVHQELRWTDKKLLGAFFFVYVKKNGLVSVLITVSDLVYLHGMEIW